MSVIEIAVLFSSLVKDDYLAFISRLLFILFLHLWLVNSFPSSFPLFNSLLHWFWPVLPVAIDVPP